MSRRALHIAFWAGVAGLSFSFFLHIQKEKEAFYQEYLRYKEFLLLLQSAKLGRKQELSESFLQQKLQQFPLQVVSIKTTEMGYEVKLRDVPGSEIPKLVYFLEDSGFSIKKLKATDNTGQATFEVEIALR
ncbi:hypothetical protein Thal_1581 [Thermocrinis albus DSM 14484]|uniref:Uncharacterized protein n=1 Tax=Thermocrinis albus (strain DSM 14484 / JCM 11386 / HI 11/12) TaxID=638303 RepID=D3SN79_THEAH|nr:hypothetical protein [Thermocrinis albus]ADC90209.1 hypothetical protein Thal_1581 [Thermocrinis albus DSM 14484]